MGGQHEQKLKIRCERIARTRKRATRAKLSKFFDGTAGVEADTVDAIIQKIIN